MYIFQSDSLFGPVIKISIATGTNSVFIPQWDKCCTGQNTSTFTFVYTHINVYNVLQCTRTKNAASSGIRFEKGCLEFHENVGKTFVSRGGNFHDTTPISFIKAYGFYFRMGNFWEEDKSLKNAKITHVYSTQMAKGQSNCCSPERVKRISYQLLCLTLEL